ncbi:unnamed protein product, partial [Didymodactylos carnosus]
YQFLVYNASVIYYNYIRPFLRDTYRQYLCDSLREVVDTLTTINDPDILWRAQLLLEIHQTVSTDREQMKNVFDRIMAYPQRSAVRGQTARYDYLNTNTPRDRSVQFSNVPSRDNENILAGETSQSKNIDGSRTTSTQKKDLNLTPSTSLTQQEKHSLLLELGRLSLLIHYTDLTKVVIDALMTIRLKEADRHLEVTLLQADYLVKHLGENEETYIKSSFDTRMRAIEMCEESLETLFRISQSDLIQTACIYIWNLCLPLLQTNLRNKIRKPLTTIANILEKLQSLNWQLRSQLHFELAKIEEDIEQLDSAKTNLLKARTLDDHEVYTERINLALDRLNVRTELYKRPDSDEDKVAMIIEQAGKASVGAKSNQRALLIEACNLLAPDAFNVVLDSENPNAIGKIRANPTAQLKGFAEHYEKCLQNTVHYERIIGETNQDKRLKLWADLTMIARKQEIWDICRTAARFCLLHDTDERRKLFSEQTENSTADKDASSLSLFQRDLLRILAEVHFIAGEAQIEFIRSRGVELFDVPVRPPMPTVPSASKVQAQLESDNDWKHYCQWLNNLSTKACNHFSQGANIGVLLAESWLICCAGEYLWNYNRHLFYSDRHRIIIEQLVNVVNALRKVGHEREILLVVNLCVALATAYIIPTLKPEMVEPPADVQTTPEKPIVGKKGAGQKDTKTEQIQPSSTAKTDDLKTALEICEYAINRTNGEHSLDIISIKDRQPVLQLWITIKQLLQQIPKSTVILGDEDDNPSSQNTLSRAVLAVDALSRLDSGWSDYKDGLDLKKTVSFVGSCSWPDSLIELQLWCRLSIIGNRANDVEVTNLCRDKAREIITLFQTKKVDKFQLSLANEYVGRACCAHAECLMKTIAGQKQDRKEALGIFAEAASYASKAELYELTMHIARHFWNNCRPMIQRKLERCLLMDLLNELNHYINSVSPKSLAKDSKDDQSKINSGTDKSQDVKSTKSITNGKKSVSDSSTTTTLKKEKSQVANIVEEEVTAKQDDDAAVRSAFYGVLIQVYVDRHQWTTAIDVMDQALSVLPRTKHRLIIYKYRVLIKSKLGLSISMDIQKFREEGESSLARMWRHVALMAKTRNAVIQAYQNAIGTLQSHETYWQKIDYIIELACCLYSNEYLIDNAVDLIDWAIDLLMTSERALKEEQTNENGANVEAGQHSNMSNKRDTQMGEAGSLPDMGHIGPTKPSAQICRRNRPEYVEYLQKAYWFIMRLWQCGLNDCIEITKQVELEQQQQQGNFLKVDTITDSKARKKSPKVEKKSEQPAKGAGGSKPGDKTVQSKPVIETSTSKSLIDWALYLPNEDTLATFALPTAKQRGINRNTISKPLLSFYYFDMLINLLREYGFNHFCLPILSLMRLIGHSIVQSAAMKTYVLLRIQQVCQELNLIDSMQQVALLARPYGIKEEDLATSRSEMLIYTKLLVQQTEEEAQFETMIGTRSEAKSYATSAYSNKNSSTLAATDDKSIISCELPGDKQTLNKLILRNIWLQTAQILFELNYIHEAKDVLQEVLKSAKIYDDSITEKKACVLLGEIALHEKRFEQAIELAIQGQKLPIDETHWFRSVAVISDALAQQNTLDDSYAYKKRKAILETAIKRLETIAQLKINKVYSIAYAASLLTARKNQLLHSLILTKCTDSLDNSMYYSFQEIIQRNDIIYDNLLGLNHEFDAAEIMLKSIEIIRKLAQDSRTNGQKRNYLIEIAPMQFPIQRQLVQIQLNLSSIFIDLLEIYAWDCLQERKRRKYTNAVNLAVEDFVEQEKTVETDTIKWKEIAKILPDKLTVSLMSIMELSGGGSDKPVKAKVLFYLGKVYSILGHNFGIEYPLEWQPKIKDILSKMAEVVEKPSSKAKLRNESVDSKSSILNQTSPVIENENELRSIILQQKEELNNSLQLLGQSMECCLQSLNIALTIQDKELIRDTSLLLCDTIGQFDPVNSIIYLALSQSASTSLYTESVLRRSCSIPSNSELSSLLKMIDRIKQQQILSNSQYGLVQRNITETLKTSSPWKFMTIKSQYYELTKDMPTSFNYVILQHSTTGNHLYASIFNKSKLTQTASKTSGGKGTGGQVQQASGIVIPQIIKVEVDREKFIELIQEFDNWKYDYQQCLQRYEAKIVHKAAKQTMLNSEQAETVDTTTIEDFKSRFDNLLKAMNDYFTPISSLFTGYLDIDKTYDLRSQISPDNLILLLDPILTRLPLEALEIFKHVQIGIDEPIDESKKKDKKEKEPTENVEIQTVDPANVFYFTDPAIFQAKAESNNKNPSVFDILRQRFPQLVAKWKTIKQESSALNISEIERATNDGSGLIYYGSNTFNNLIGHYKIPNISKAGCSVICSFDRTSTSSSFVNETNRNTIQNWNEIQLDRSTENALLLSCGAFKLILQNQWTATLNENETSIINTFTDVATLKCSLGQALRLTVYPYFRPVEADTTTEKMNDKKKVATAKGGKRSPSPKSGSKTKGSDAAKKKQRSPSPIKTETIDENIPEQRQRPPIELKTINPVIYGLPNYTFLP